jgi:hypothetical protein
VKRRNVWRGGDVRRKRVRARRKEEKRAFVTRRKIILGERWCVKDMKCEENGREEGNEEEEEVNV